MVKAISLFSGGLDSILATKLILEQGVEIEAVNFSTVFFSTRKTKNNFNLLLETWGVKLNTFEVNQEFIEIIKHPKHGYGANLNPCIDCRIFMLKKAKEFMKKTGASFIITGEVLNERPMSQRKSVFKLIEEETGLEGLILRPLSARLLPLTFPEKQGLVDRSRLLDISGRSRKLQLKLAEQFGIKDYLWPAGGCLLTDPNFSKRVIDLLKYRKDFSLKDIEFLKIGRHFRLSEKAKLIIARDGSENEKLLDLAEPEDLIFYPKIKRAPIALGRGEFNLDLIKLSGSILANYSLILENKPIEIIYRKRKDDQENTILCCPLREIESYRI